jgi:tripartite-type tricarboxylate transporter receptor subunit TctC
MELIGYSKREQVRGAIAADPFEEDVMSRLRSIIYCASALALLASSESFATSEAFPAGVIRIVVPTGPGTPPDIISRVIAAELSKTEGWRMVVENRPGALQTIGMTDVLNQPADGHTVYPMSVPTMAVPALLPKMKLKPDSDFAPVLKVSSSYNVLVVNPSFPVKSLPELIAALKGQPGKFNFSSAGFGTPAHLIGEMFKLQSDVQVTHVPYQQAQQRVSDLLNGTNQFDFLASVTAANFADSGKLRAIAVTAPNRVAGLMDVPTVVEQGYPNLVVEDYVGFAVKNGTAPEIIARLNTAMNKALQTPKVREALANLGAVPAGGTAAEFGALISQQIAHWGKVVKDSGIKMPE